MKDHWKFMINKLDKKRLSSTTWTSERKSLEDIFKKADEWDLDPIDALRTPLCRLRTIIKEAKQAIEDDDPNRLAGLFHLAANTPLADIRLTIGSAQPSRVQTVKIKSNGGEMIGLFVSPAQLERIQKDTKLHFLFD